MSEPDQTPEQQIEIAGLQKRLAELEARLAAGRVSEEMMQRYQFMANASTDFMTLINREHVYEAANEAYCRAHQKSLAEIVGKSVAEVWGKTRYEAEIKPRLEMCFAGQEVYYEGWFEFATLGRRFFDVTYYPYRSRRDEITHVVVVSRDNTRYKELEEQLRHSEQRYRLVSDLTSNYAYSFGLTEDGEYVLEWVTDAFSRLTGYGPGEVRTRKQWLALTHPDDIPAISRREEAIRSGYMNVSEYRILTRDGEVRWLRDHIRPIWSRRKHAVVRLFGAVQDITVRKTAEAERERFTTLLQTAAEVSRQVTALLDTDELLTQVVQLVKSRFNFFHVQVYLYDKESDMLVLRAGSGPPHPSPEHRLPLDHPGSLTARAARTGQTVMVNEIKHQPELDTGLFLPDVQSQISAPLVAGSTVLGVLEIQDTTPRRFQRADISAIETLAGQLAIALQNARIFSLRRQAEQAWRVSEERYTLASQVGKVGVWDWNLVTGTLYVSPNMKAILGYSDDEVPNTPEGWYNLIHPDDREAVQTIAQAHLEGLTPQYGLEYRMRHKDGSIRWMLSRGIASRDETGKAIRLAGANTDITELKQVQEALQYLLTLESIVTSLSTRFISTPPEQIEDEFRRALRIIGGFFEADAALILTRPSGEPDWTVDYLWVKAPAAVHLSEGDSIPGHRFGWGEAQLQKADYLYLNPATNLPPEAAPVRKFLRRLDVQSLVAVPLMFSGSQEGVLVLTNISQESVWPRENISPLRLVGQMFVNALERKRTDEQLQASLAEKEILLKEIHHRVKNNLQIISSLLDLQAAYIRDPADREYFKDSQSRIKSMALVHENLYRASDLANIDFGEYVHHLVDYLQQIYDQGHQVPVKIETDIEPFRLEIDVLIPCGLIITELVSNSLKYAFANQPVSRPKIWIHLKRLGAQAKLVVGDNGIGIPQTSDLAAAKSLGWRLVDRLVKQIDGQMVISSGNGVTFEITFPL